MKRISLAIFSAIFLTAYSVSPVSALTDLQLGAISQNCATIKQTLTQLQRADSRTRTYLGATYEVIASKFITPLNLRLINNGRPNTDLFAIQSDFTATQAKFREAYTEYMRELEGMIAVNCQEHPQEFYNHLERTRKKRSELQSATSKLSELAKRQYQAVLELEKSL